MILQPCTVELTKIQYHDKNDAPFVIPTISREILDNHVNANVTIKKKLFGQKWVLKINEISGQEKFQWRIIVYTILLSCIVVAVVFGLYFSLFHEKLSLGSLPANKTAIVRQSDEETALLVPKTVTTHENSIFLTKLCENCSSGHICLKLSEIDVPKCVLPLDRKDPTGCGGFCYVNTQFCQLLGNEPQVYQCSNLKNTLKCSANAFNCGNMCINKNKRCDGTIDCSNKSDEMACACNLETHFRCGNMTSCLPKPKQCDGTVDCWDKSDETGCKLACKNGTIPCLNGECIPKEHFCDGKYQCSDQSDEPQGCQ